MPMHTLFCKCFYIVSSDVILVVITEMCNLCFIYMQDKNKVMFF